VVRLLHALSLTLASHFNKGSIPGEADKNLSDDNDELDRLRDVGIFGKIDEAWWRQNVAIHLKTTLNLHVPRLEFKNCNKIIIYSGYDVIHKRW
jgi:hypothetical protein